MAPRKLTQHLGPVVVEHPMCGCAAVALLVEQVFFREQASHRHFHDRAAPLGYCQKCGYDVAGIVSEVRPECGEAVDRA